jgi:hypothetical protein
MKKQIFSTFLGIALLCIALQLNAQVAVNTDLSAPDNSAMLDVKSTSKGMLVPRMTAAQRDAISNPANGLLIFCTDNNQFYSFKELAGGGGGNWVMINSQWLSVGSDISYMSGNVGIGTTAPAQKLAVEGVFRSSQVAINANGNSPDNSALIDASSTTKGLLIPRMTLAQRNAISSPATGLMIYQTTNTPGFYYNSGTSTIPAWVMTGTGSFWGLTGNSGSGAASFIGTTDNVPLTLKINNQLAGRIDQSSTSFGYQSLNSNAGGLYNAAFGVQALFSNTLGSRNTAVGNQALFFNTSGGYNTAIGDQALHSNSTGYSNVAIGTNALRNNLYRSNLVAVGDSVLYNNGVGVVADAEARDNTGVGSKALFSNTSGNGNTANGFRALYESTTGSGNTALGSNALYHNTTGSSNEASGSQALFYNTTGYNNVANGNQALYSNSTGNYNVASGGSALLSNSTGSSNAAIGPYALSGNSSGGYNFAGGDHALDNNTTGSYNTAIGSQAMHANVDGSWNTCIGEYTNTSIGNLAGATSLGASAVTNGNNKIVIGANIGGMVIGGYANWSNLSDGRFKENIREDVPGLAFVGLLRPVTYRINTEKLQRHITAQMPDSIALRYLPTADQQAIDREYMHTGFIAQEVEASAKSIGYAFDGVNAPKNPTDNYSLAYSQFVPSLVRAVQELNEKNMTQQKTIDNLNDQNLLQQKHITDLEARLENLEKLVIK